MLTDAADQSRMRCVSTSRGMAGHLGRWGSCLHLHEGGSLNQSGMARQNQGAPSSGPMEIHQAAEPRLIIFCG